MLYKYYRVGWITLVMFRGFNKFKCRRWLLRHTQPPPQSLKGSPKGIHPTPKPPPLSKSLFKSSKHQTETPCPFSLPPVARSILISPADWGPLSSPEKPAAIQTGSPVAGAGVGVSARLWELQPNSCLLVTQTEHVARKHSDGCC